MIDTADLAILETHLDVMNPVERGLVEEIRRLHDEAKDVAALEGKVLELEEELDATKSDLRDATAEVETLTSDLAASEAHQTEIAKERDAAEGALAKLKASMRELVAA